MAGVALSTLAPQSRGASAPAYCGGKGLYLVVERPQFRSSIAGKRRRGRQYLYSTKRFITAPPARLETQGAAGSRVKIHDASASKTESSDRHVPRDSDMSTNAGVQGEAGRAEPARFVVFRV